MRAAQTRRAAEKPSRSNCSGDLAALACVVLLFKFDETDGDESKCTGERFLDRCLTEESVI